MKQMDISNYWSDANMNREQRRALAKAKQKWIATLPDELALVAEDDPFLPYSSHASDISEVWRSKKFMVIVWKVPAGKKLSISRQDWDSTERKYLDGITWDEIQQVKREVGLGEMTGIEFFPRDSELVNFANVRHIWILPDDKLVDYCLSLTPAIDRKAIMKTLFSERYKHPIAQDSAMVPDKQKEKLCLIL